MSASHPGTFDPDFTEWTAMYHRYGLTASDAEILYQTGFVEVDLEDRNFTTPLQRHSSHLAYYVTEVEFIDWLSLLNFFEEKGAELDRVNYSKSADMYNLTGHPITRFTIAEKLCSRLWWQEIDGSVRAGTSLSSHEGSVCSNNGCRNIKSSKIFHILSESATLTNFVNDSLRVPFGTNAYALVQGQVAQ
jgi:hypothetical protein